MSDALAHVAQPSPTGRVSGDVLALWDFPLFPEAAAEGASRVDMVFFVLFAMSAVLVIAVFGLILFFMFRYRAGTNADRSHQIRNTLPYEITWTTATFVLLMVLFAWAAGVYYRGQKPPQGATTYHVLGKQWMWEIQHPNGRRELNEMHVPIGEPVKLVLASEDVIHSFYVPAFRIKQDAVPGMYTTVWFTPSKPGAYQLFCAEYCGTNHSRMTGTIYVMKSAQYEEWLHELPEVPASLPMEEKGRASFRRLGCRQCHKPDTAALAPMLEGLFGTEVTLRDGSTVVADEQYIRESIIDPAAKVVRGYQAIMPTYKGVIDEHQLSMLIAAVRGLGDQFPAQSQERGEDQPVEDPGEDEPREDPDALLDREE